MPDRKAKYTTISIPRELYRRVEDIIQDTGFRSPTEYIVYLVRQAVVAIEADRQLIYSLPYTISSTDEEQGEP
jgi:metal-responsive CopG/Arc/MetJ family transcriptional regulator